jgi:hypothetical protein
VAALGLLPLLVGVVMLSRTKRAVRAVASVWTVRLDVLPLTVTAVENVVPSVLVWMVNAPEFQPVFSAPRPACLTTKERTVELAPRSMVSDDGEVRVQNLLLPTIRPSVTMPGPSAAAQGACGLVAVLPRARFVPRFGAAGGGVNPWLNDGGTSPVPVPQLLPALLPMVKLSVPPAAMSR